jgi:lysine 2,3-aminomutase
MEDSNEVSPSEEVEPPRNKNIAVLLPEWKGILRRSLSGPRSISDAINVKEKEITDVCKKYPALINPYYLSLIKERGDPIYKQCIPSKEELSDDFGQEDPLNEEPEHQKRHGVPTLITHRYPDRILFRVSNQCAMYCRFCTRKRKVGDFNKQPTWKEVEEGLNYVREHPEIRDVLLSGGDPLMLNDNVLEKIIKEVYTILHNRKNAIIRIGTRMPCVLPQRITPELCQMLRKYHPIYVNTHFNHPNEITPESRKACEMLADYGIPVGCQTVLLKGVNDKSEVMKELMQGLVSMRVRPYYIYQADPVKGTNHFRTRVEKGQEIYKAIRGHTSGLCVPTYVIDAPDGGGKVPAIPSYITEITDEKVVMKNFEGETHEYPQIKDYI